MKKFALLTVAAASLMSWNAAFAADEVVQDYAAPGAAGNWAGAYIGGYGEGGYVHHDFVEGGGLGTASANYPTYGGGVFGGINFQNGAIVYGIDANVGYFDHTETVTGVPGPGVMTSKIGWNGAVKARVGRDMGAMLPYVSAGVAAADLDTFWPFGPAARSATLYGGVLGAGIDYKFAGNLFARGEYDFTFYNGTALEYCGGFCVMNHALSSHSIKLGLGVQF